MTIFDDAEALVLGPRQQQYGPPADNLTRIASMWTALLRHDVTPSQVALCMVALKLVRAAHAPKRDNLVDAAGYLRLIEMCEQ